VPQASQELFLRLYIQGDHIRQETSDDLVLIEGLRVLLPAYAGPGIILYRVSISVAVT
jgi:hypothetical protein